MKNTLKCHKPLFFAAALCALASSFLSAQARPSQRAQALNSQKTFSVARKHPGAITACAQGANVAGDAVFFFGDDAGFLSMHRVAPASQNGQQGFSSIMEGIWQVGDLPIKMIAAHPAGKLVAVYESDDFSAHRVSLWNWPEKRRVYAKRFQDSVNAISWSAGGTYLMVANTSFNGITFLQGEAGTATRPFKSPPGIVNLSATGKSERSVVNYAPAGRIVYTSLSSGETIEEHITEPNLYSTSLCNNNRTIIGFTEKAVFALNALDGTVVSRIGAANPVAATASTDTEPVWFERASGAWVLRQGERSPVRIDLPAGSRILAAAGTDRLRIFGTNTGDIYVFADATLNKEESASITQATGICAKGGLFYFIADGSLYRAGKYGEPPALLLSSSKGAEGALFGTISSKIDSCAPLDGDSLLLWSSSSSAPLVRFNERTGNATRIYTPRRGITSLSVMAAGIALVEGNSRAVFIGDGSAAPYVYSDTGLQDAVMVSSSHMLIAKSADARSAASLILVDIATGEIAPLNLSADICFSLNAASGRNDLLFAYSVASENERDGKSTELKLIRLILEQLSKSEIETIAVYSDEDLSAKLFSLSPDRVLATLGKTGLSEISLPDGRQRVFERTYSLPAKIAATEKAAATLNCDGSISWYSISGKAAGNLALSAEGEWMWDASR